MADERYQWLDPEAAERLLRGEPVDPVDPAARTPAAALADALDAARVSAAPAPGVPLAGEEAAVAAFRTATAARAAASAEAGSSVSADLGRVRLAAVPAAGRHWGRSLRYGLAAALAAVTVGGVAVAAGTGVLPLVDKEPSRTVTAAETATPTDPSEPSAGIERHPDPSRSADPGRPAGTPEPGRDATARPEDGTLASPRPGVTPSGESGRGEDDATAPDRSTVEAKAKACREYRAGRLDEAGRDRLAGALRAGESLRAHCDALLGSATEKEDDGEGKDKGKDDEEKDAGEGDDESRENVPDVGHGTVPTPTDSGRKRGRGGADKPDPKDRPKAKPKAKTQVTAGVRALALCPAGAPEPGV
ncbi:hypothetical protein ACFQ8C_15785 [Streptomyces sp. NPDC056503]|uniref:hypothetical protein n=1 Tax=Streptomyces sp. NPDC056503 TaxID=3345842 RepID=UPI0036C8F869